MSDETEISLLIGPANYAGQATAWAQAVRANIGVAAVSAARKHTPWGLPIRRGGFGYTTDIALPHLRTTTHWTRQRRLRRQLAAFSHVAIDGFLPFSGTLESDISYMRVRSEVALIAHGSDVRDPSGHMQRLAESYFRIATPEWVKTLDQTARRNRALARESGLALFVSTPDLLLDLPEAAWLPVVVDTQKWTMPVPARLSDRRAPRAAPLRVLHVPSRRSPAIKGTSFIAPVLEDLHARRLIEHIDPGMIAHNDMPDLVRSADVVVDQIQTGSYGVGAVEAMAAGRIVVGNVSNDIRALMPDAPPIINATPLDFHDVMISLLERDVDDLADLSSQGRRFAATWHDGRESANVLRNFLR